MIVYGCSRSSAQWSHLQYHHIVCDVCDEPSVSNMIRDIYRQHGKLDIAVNCAAIAAMNHSLLTPATTLRNLLETNVTGTFIVCREAAKIMKRAGQGQIINFSSIAVPMNLEGQSAYVASKSAVEGLTRVLAQELSSFGISVNAIGPGPTDTRLTRQVPTDIMNKTLKRTGRTTLDNVEDTLPALDRILAADPTILNGEVIYVYGTEHSVTPTVSNDE